MTQMQTCSESVCLNFRVWCLKNVALRCQFLKYIFGYFWILNLNERKGTALPSKFITTVLRTMGFQQSYINGRFVNEKNSYAANTYFKIRRLVEYLCTVHTRVHLTMMGCVGGHRTSQTE